jgi:hypothetical protein
MRELKTSVIEKQIRELPRRSRRIAASATGGLD